jgi:O-antigen/teichoic acid export membrane protein
MIVRNTVMGWTARGVNLATSLISVPILVHYLGKAGFGVWLLLMNIWALAGLFDLGIYQAYVRYVAHDFASGDESSLAMTNASCLWLYLIISGLVLLVYGLVMYFADAMFSIPAQQTDLVRWALIPLALSSAIGFPARIFEGLLFAQEKIYLYTAIGIPLSLARLGLMIGLLEMGWGLMGVALAFLAGTLAEYLLVAVFSVRNMPFKHWFSLGWHPQRIKELLKYAGNTLLLIVGNKFRQRLPTLMMGFLSHPVAVAKFGVGMRLVSQSVDQVMSSAIAAQSRFSLLASAGETEKLREVFVRSCFYTGLIAGYLGVGVALLAEPFIRLWLGPDFAESAQVVHILIVPMSLFAALSPCEAILYSLKKQRVTGIVSLAEVALMALVYFMILAQTGATGAALGLGIGLIAIRPWFLPTYVCRHIELSVIAFWLKSVGRAWLILALAALPLWLLLEHWHLDGWLELVAAGLLLTLVCGGFILLGLGARERTYWREKLGSLLRRLASQRTAGKKDA